MNTALGREREVRLGRRAPSSELEEDKTGSHEVDGSLLEKLQRELDDKHAQVRLHHQEESFQNKSSLKN